VIVIDFVIGIVDVGWRGAPLRGSAPPHPQAGAMLSEARHRTAVRTAPPALGWPPRGLPSRNRFHEIVSISLHILAFRSVFRRVFRTNW